VAFTALQRFTVVAFAVVAAFTVADAGKRFCG
jgi:hypothetical protein